MPWDTGKSTRLHTALCLPPLLRPLAPQWAQQGSLWVLLAWSLAQLVPQPCAINARPHTWRFLRKLHKVIQMMLVSLCGTWGLCEFLWVFVHHTPQTRDTTCQKAPEPSAQGGASQPLWSVGRGPRAEATRTTRCRHPRPLSAHTPVSSPTNLPFFSKVSALFKS